ncbi:uncharacterized protein RAG0_00463 [Rhynchosporium agropyri]|uniref:Uncharacterized protein n=1 Tax=Rhynchosporium agropyri TaxID=914238 RepID=A0A1E1JT67_9HELO|nr:uncharacterized protein RAG0_00463 [Rhynchosporium agropyri]
METPMTATLVFAVQDLSSVPKKAESGISRQMKN